LRKEDLRAEELLAGGSLSGRQHDEILARVLDRTETADRPRPRLRGRTGLVLCAAAVPALAAWLILVSPARDAFQAKGPPQRTTAAIDIGCTSSGSRVCPMGGTLAFVVNAAVTSGYLGAYAERLDDPSHARIWYFPTAAGASPLIAPGTGTIVLPDGIQLGSEHRPGRYRVTVWISSRPVDRDEMDAAAPGMLRDRSSFDLEVVR
jgi:hypothetical protein